LKVIQFKDEAERLDISIEAVRFDFEKALVEGKALGVISPKKTEFISFKPAEIEELAHELFEGRISLDNLAGELSLSVYQVSCVLQYLLKTNRINESLTYSYFISNATLKKAALEVSKERKRNHRRKMAAKPQ
jgi:hypothetical protein